MPLGGGTTSINAVELRDKCDTNGCSINGNIPLLTNHVTFIYKPIYDNFTDGIYFEGTIDLFINHGSITTYYNNAPTNHSFSFVYKTEAGFNALINYGYISGGVGSNDNKNIHITNYGVMGGVDSGNITLTNYGVIKPLSYKDGKKYHFGSTNLTLQTSLMTINENASIFNAFSGTASDDSHLVLKDSKSAKFENGDSKIILAFSDAFEFSAGYLFSKLVVDTSGNNALGVDLSRLIPKSDIYYLTQSGDSFIVNRAPQYGIIGTLHKSNIHTMNNFYTMSNSMIYPRKLQKSQNLGRTHSLLQHSPSLSTSGVRGWVEYPSLRVDSTNLRISSLRADSQNLRGNPHYENIVNSTLDSAFSLKSYESFAYRNESVNRRIQRQNKRNYNRRLPNQRNLQNLTTDSVNETNQNNSSLRASEYERGNPKDLRAKRSNHPQNQRFSQTPHNYYFILTPFFNHNSFAKSGNYNLSGFDYGFLTAFSTKVAESNSLGAYFIFSYGNLGDSKDKDLSIKSLNLNLGINYKLDLIWDMYLKARGDFYYFSNTLDSLTIFSNTLDSLTIKNIKPNNLGFGLSVAYGKDFNFGKGGILGLEAGIDYKALKTNEVSLNSQTYKQSLLNLIYADLGINYNKYFGGFGINFGTGFKANLAPKLAESTLLINTQTLKFTLDNDKYLAYANVGISYLLNTKNFDMEFSLAYYGNFGDRVISNGGGVEWRVWW